MLYYVNNFVVCLTKVSHLMLEFELLVSLFGILAVNFLLRVLLLGDNLENMCLVRHSLMFSMRNEGKKL